MTFIQEKKIHKSPTLRMLKKPKFLVLKLTLGCVSTSRNTKKIEENFPYTPLSSSVYSRHSVILLQYFSLSIFFWYLYLTYPPSYKKNQCCLAYYVVYTLHVSLYRRVLGITTMVDWRRVRDRGVVRNFKMFSCFQCFK